MTFINQSWFICKYLLSSILVMNNAIDARIYEFVGEPEPKHVESRIEYFEYLYSIRLLFAHP